MEKQLKVAPGGVVRKVALLHFTDQGKVLFARTRGQALAYTVGGKVKEGETDEEALIREVKEETGVDLIPESIRFYFLFQGPCHGYVEGTLLKMLCFTADFIGTPTPCGEIEQLVELDESDIGKGRTTVMGDAILDHVAYNAQR